jgi:hypothetical protein
VQIRDCSGSAGNESINRGLSRFTDSLSTIFPVQSRIPQKSLKSLIRYLAMAWSAEGDIKTL